MKKFSWSVVLAATLVGACSTISKRQTAASYPYPPDSAQSMESESESAAIRDPKQLDQLLEKKLRETPTEPMRLLVRYHQAKLWSEIDREKSCKHWLEVASAKGFPLARVVQLRALEVCPKDHPGLPSIQALTPSPNEPWLTTDLTKAVLARAIAVKNDALEMRLSLEVAKTERVQADQIKLLERAIALANQAKDESFKAQALAALHEAAPRFIPDPAPEQYLLVAADYRRARKFAKAREYYKKAIAHEKTSDVDRLKALDGIRMTYKLAKNTEQYIRATKDYADFARRRFFLEAKKDPASDQPARHLNAQLTLARAVWTEHSPRQAWKILEQVEKDLGGKHPIDESLYLRARIEEEAKRFTSTIDILGSIDTKRVSDPELRSKVLWYRAWNLRKMGRLQEAADALQQLSEIAEMHPAITARNRFWLGRTLKEISQDDRAKAEFEWLIANDPLGYYGTLAYRELGRQLPPLSPSDVVSSVRTPAGQMKPPAPTKAGADSTFGRDLSFFTPDESVTFEWLIATKEGELGRRYLDSLMAAKPPKPGTPESLEALKSYARTGNYIALFWRVYDLPPETRQEILGENPELVFPQPWKPSVSDASKRFDVPLELIYSIMRQESSFNPQARSHADAFGLMQLIPSMAKRAGRKAGIKVTKHEDLYVPEINIPLGAAFIRGTLDRWKGKFVPAVASYNASERAVRGWVSRWQKSKGQDPLVFIEDVPYEETRTYIKLVMRNFVFYSRLNSGGAPIDFPEWCLQGLQGINQ